MFQPIADFEIGVAFHYVAPDAVGTFKLVKPFIDQLRGIVVIWIEKAREHSRSSASPPSIVDDGPELDEQQPSVARELTDRLGLRKFRFDRANPTHYSAPKAVRASCMHSVVRLDAMSPILTSARMAALREGAVSGLRRRGNISLIELGAA
jgi:hypothetical protein